MGIQRGGRRILRRSLLHRQCQHTQPPQVNCHVPSRWQSTQDNTPISAKLRHDPEFQKLYACNNPRFPLSLSGADNLNFNDTESWPLPDVFPQEGERAPPYLDFPSAFAKGGGAFLHPELSFADHGKISSSTEEVRRKLHWGDGKAMNWMNLSPGGPSESALYLRLSNAYLQISQGEEEPSSGDWLKFLLSLADSIHTTAGDLMSKICYERLVTPAMFATTRFLEELSLPTALERIQGMVTPNFHDYLRSQLFMADTFRPKFRVDPKSIKPFPPKTPYILLGHPHLYAVREHYLYGTHLDPPEDFGIDKIRAPISESDPKEFVHINKFENVAIVYSGHFPMPKPFTYRGLIKNFRRYGHPLVRHHIRNGTLSVNALAEAMYPGDELSFIVDIPMEAVIGLGIVDKDDQVVAGQSMELRKFVVTLRSNHVAPGWKFNKESVRWYIDDFNLTKRRIEWGEPLPDPDP